MTCFAGAVSDLAFVSVPAIVDGLPLELELRRDEASSRVNAVLRLPTHTSYKLRWGLRIDVFDGSRVS